MSSTTATPCKVRYTKGPETLSFGDLPLKRGEWSAPVTNDLAGECLRAGHVESYGFEAEGYVPPPPATEAAAEPPLPPGPRARRTAAELTPATDTADQPPKE